MAQPTKLELTQLLAAANARIAALTEQLSIKTAECDMFARTTHNAIARNDGVDPITGQKPKRVGTTPRKTIYEWDPALVGDFKRAQELARANGGIVARKMS